MATDNFVAISIPEATKLADFTGIRVDFETAREFANQLIELLEKDPPEHQLAEPMTIAILVRYSRPFAKGVRRWLSEGDLATLSESQGKAHEMFRNWRDKHIAHSVNPFEENQPVARYWDERLQEEGFTSVECNSQRLSSMGTANLRTFIGLVLRLIEIVETKIAYEKERVLAIVRSKPTADVLATDKRPTFPKLSDAGKVRKRN